MYRKGDGTLVFLKFLLSIIFYNWGYRNLIFFVLEYVNIYIYTIRLKFSNFYLISKLQIGIKLN